ncbi:SpoIVB peptidase S55 domain-containing protein [Romboutsia ilealis]|uniref:SpoIVB peptidase S55 domain-containing protein n=1 Tax=Romboutsia ilealis TaxID=1115758 RepID=UPI002731BB70|nr:SpoIVB peptidase S55 domain-containing protein [Romboutsia ilealis]
MNDKTISTLKKVLSTTLVIILLGSSFVFCDENPISKNTKLMPSGDVIELGVKLKYPIVRSKLNRNKTLKESDILLSIKLNGEEIIPSRKNIEKTMRVENLPLKATCYRKGKVKSIDITSDDLRDFEFGYYSYYLGTVTAIDSKGNFIGLSHNLKDEQMPFDVLDNAVYKTCYVQTKKNTLFNTGYLVTSAEGDKIGKFTGSGDGGICGKFESYTYNPNLALETGTPKVGTAYLYCKSPVTNELKMHEIEISQVGKEVSQIKIIDKDLLKYRGGIVQGMSGTPIIQDNKIVGGARAVVKSNKRIGVMTNIDYMIKNCNK